MGSQQPGGSHRLTEKWGKQSLKVCPEYLITGNTSVARLGFLLVSSLSFQEMGFLGKEERPAGVCLGF